MNRIKSILLWPMVLLVLPAAAQQGLPDSLRFTIRKEYRPVARDAKRLLSMPTVPPDTVELPKMDYTILPVRKEVGYETQPLEAAQLAPEPLPKLRSGHLKAGFGNYTMPFFEASYGTGRNKDYQAGGFARYHASFAELDSRPFGFTDAGVSVFGKKFMEGHTLGAALEYDHDGSFFYGYSPDDTVFVSSDIRQAFNHVGIALDLNALRGKGKVRTIDHASVRYGYTGDRFGSTEHAVGLGIALAFPIKKERLLAKVSGDYFRNDMPTRTLNNGLVTIGPEFRAERKRWAIGIGADLTLDINDTATVPLIFPMVDFHYFLVEDIMRIYAQAKGGAQRVGLHSISQHNPFAHTDIDLSNGWERLNVGGGLKGIITRAISFDLSAAHMIIGQQLFWVNDWADGVGNRFVPEYHDVSITSFKGALSYHLKERLQVAAQAEYRLFTMPTDSIAPWHEAPFRFTLSGNYSFNDRLILRLGLLAMGERKAKPREFTGIGTAEVPHITLKGFADINLGAEYRFKDWVGAFIDLRNIAAMRYELWERYPSQRFSFIAGVHFSF